MVDVSTQTEDPDADTTLTEIEAPVFEALEDIEGEIQTKKRKKCN
jgi:hypothetical protein